MAKIVRKVPNEPEGKTISLGETVYGFKPDANGENVCEVADKAHVAHLLALDDGRAYALHSSEVPAPKPPKPKAKKKR